MTFAFGSTIAPILGGSLCDMFQYKTTSDIMAAVSFALAFAILINVT
jgi:hypothetical protein